MVISQMFSGSVCDVVPLKNISFDLMNYFNAIITTKNICLIRKYRHILFFIPGIPFPNCCCSFTFAVADGELAFATEVQSFFKQASTGKSDWPVPEPEGLSIVEYVVIDIFWQLTSSCHRSTDLPSSISHQGNLLPC